MGHISFNSDKYPGKTIELHDNDHTFFKILVRNWLWEPLHDDDCPGEDVRIPNIEELERFLARKKLKIVGVKPIVLIPFRYDMFKRDFTPPMSPIYLYCEPVK